MRFPIRARLTLVSAALMAVLLLGMGAFVYLRLKTELLQTVDTGLRSRADALLEAAGSDPLPEGSGLVEAEDAFAQVLGADGRVLDSSRGLSVDPLLSSDVVETVATATFFDSDVRTVEDVVPARLLAVRTDGGQVVVVGTAVEDQQTALARLLAVLAIGGPIAVGLASGVGWLVAGAALRPVERMRAEADAVSASEPGRRLPLPASRDEVHRLGETLNRMLGRLEDAVERERRFVGDASHEIRTPLANLKAEVDLALRRSRTSEELTAALRSASEETDRLARLAEDLLVLARAEGGRLPMRREDLDMASLLRNVVSSFSRRASELGVSIESRIREGPRARVDPARLRQAVGNLLDNALRHTPRGGTVTVDLERRERLLSIHIADTGKGFSPSFLPVALEPFSRADSGRARDDGGTGLGLAIVRAIAEAHGGSVEVGNGPGGGAFVVIRVPE